MARGGRKRQEDTLASLEDADDFPDAEELHGSPEAKSLLFMWDNPDSGSAVKQLCIERYDGRGDGGMSLRFENAQSAARFCDILKSGARIPKPGETYPVPYGGGMANPFVLNPYNFGSVKGEEMPAGFVPDEKLLGEQNTWRKRMRKKPLVAEELTGDERQLLWQRQLVEEAICIDGEDRRLVHVGNISGTTQQKVEGALAYLFAASVPWPQWMVERKAADALKTANRLATLAGNAEPSR